ncbi:MAG: HAMP domain-containing sensor histidine kinase [Candidatus Acidiferrales bacterium]
MDIADPTVKTPSRERVLSAAVIIPVALIVAILAVLQYRWSNQVSEATSLGLADSLQMSMVNWHLDLFHDFSQICVALGVDPDGYPPSDLQQFARSFAEWQAGSEYPDLVSNLYVLRPDGPAYSDALRFNASTGRFERDQWPTNLAAFREKLSRASAVSMAATHRTRQFGKPASQSRHQQLVDGFYPSGLLGGWRFEPSIPIILHPIFGELGHPESVQWIVIELNDNVIRNQILPDLVRRYFEGTDGLDFQVAVIGGSPERVIYASDSSFVRKKIVDADGTMDLFGRVQDQALGSPVHVFHKPSDNRGPAAAVGVAWFPLLSDAPKDEDWQLVVTHRTGGPMGAFAAGLRRRDLMISFGALLLLVLSMGTLMITSHKKRLLAKLQFDFVTTVSHELRTPLTVISSAADNIVHGYVESKQQLAQYGTVIGTQARQLSGLVEQILLFAAVREGQQRYSPRLLTVSEIVDKALANTSALIRIAEFTVEQDVEPDLPCVMSDLTALSQCLENLITNALKYGSQQRWIGIAAHLNENGPKGREVEISVSDRGIGIESIDLPHIFEPFYRSSAVVATQIRGTGLGLSLAKSIAEATNGRLTVASVPGRGSTFTLHLPCVVPSLEDSEVCATPEVVGR